ncbi:MAG: PBP1A family penicillin-binding protein [Bdellovibrionales bacterium]|nr:PBP1A family penicillin-binding protein [Bdellovibrionales bacterium]
MTNFKKLFIVGSILTIVGLFSGTGIYFYYASQLPELFSVEDYDPLLVSEVYARNGEKIGEFFRENRKLIPFEEIPKDFISAFLSAEDSDFFEHNGFNFKGIFRAVLANLTSGSRSQGASTITQQAARTLFLSSEKTYSRKLKEAILARRMEKHLSKENILYLYLNQIYFGQGAYGIVSAAETFFRKKVQDLSIAEMAVLAGAPKAPSAFNIVANPQRAKTRQLYVLRRMLETGRITQDQHDVAANETLKVYRIKKYKEVAPYFVETIRQLLVSELGEDVVLNKGIKVYSSLDFKAQKLAQTAVRKGLRDLDKRQGYRGAKKNIELSNQEDVQNILTTERNRLIDEAYDTFEVFADGSTNEYGEFAFFQEKNDTGQTTSNLPPYMKVGDIVEAIVTKVDDKHELVFVKFAEAQGVIPLEGMAWARPVDPEKTYGEYLHIDKPSKALKVGDVIDVKVVAKTGKRISRKEKPTEDLGDYAELELEQEPRAQAALLSFDLESDDIIAMVGGSDFRETKLNRTYQARRQTGSSFKPIVYAAGLDRGLTPATPIMGAPIVYNQTTETKEDEAKPEGKSDEEGQMNEEEVKVWKPGNYAGRFTGDILLRNALKKSLNTPTIRVLEKTGVSFVAEYARRLGIFSPLNMDMSLALGSSGVSLYEMTKVFSVFAKLGKNIRPLIIHEIKDRDGNSLAQEVSFDLHFKEDIAKLKQEFLEKREQYEKKMMAQDDETQRVSPFFFNDPDQLISPQTAFLVTTILQAAVNEPGGTGVRARRLGREVAAKTGTTNGYYDAWFMGYTPNLIGGVWVGFDQEKTLGRGEAGGRAALPIWLDYMEPLLNGTSKEAFPIPNDIVFANIDNETGRLASASSHEVVRQAFRTGTEPGAEGDEQIERQEEEDKTDFYREEF